jgi:hypothetical protein
LLRNFAFQQRKEMHKALSPTLHSFGDGAIFSFFLIKQKGQEIMHAFFY